MTADGRLGRREMYAAQTRAAVLDAAKTLFVSNGFHATSIDEIAQLARSSKGAVYHHFRDKRQIFAEVYHASQEALVHQVIASMTSSTEGPWDRVYTATRLFLSSYVVEHDARTLLGQVLGVLGWEGVRKLDEETALPFLRATLEDSVSNGYARPVPIDATVEIYFSVFCNAIFFVAAADDPEKAAKDVEVAIHCALEGLKVPPNSPGVDSSS